MTLVYGLSNSSNCNALQCPSRSFTITTLLSVIFRICGTLRGHSAFAKLLVYVIQDFLDITDSYNLRLTLVTSYVRYLLTYLLTYLYFLLLELDVMCSRSAEGVHIIPLLIQFDLKEFSDADSTCDSSFR